MKKIALHWQILIAILLALFAGSLFPGIVPYVSWMGSLFIRALKMIVVPLVLASLISGVTHAGDSASLGRLGIRTISYYLITSLLAILTGLILVNLIQPGSGLGKTVRITSYNVCYTKLLRMPSGASRMIKSVILIISSKKA